MVVIDVRIIEIEFHLAFVVSKISTQTFALWLGGWKPVPVDNFKKKCTCTFSLKLILQNNS